MTIVYTVTSPTVSATTTNAAIYDSYFSTRGDQIVDNHGNRVRIAGVNWLGMEGPTGAPGGLWTRSYQNMMDQMVQSGFNTIRLAISGDTLRATSPAQGINYSLNPDLVQLTPSELMNKIVAYAGQIGLRVIIDYHRLTAGVGNQKDTNGLWYDSQHSQADWISQLSGVAARYANNPTVIGIDLFNEPHGLAHWGNVDGLAGDTTDWAAAATQAGNAILSVNPNMLIFVEGVAKYDHWYLSGGNLSGVGTDPVRLNIANRVVYSPHEYPYSRIPGAQNVPWLQNLTVARYDQIWTQHWGYIHDQNIAPIMLGEFGAPGAIPQDQPYGQGLLPYLQGGGQGISWTFFAWNASTVNGGVLEADWHTVNPTIVDWLHADMAPIYSTNAYAAILNSPSTHFLNFTVTLTQHDGGDSILYYHTQDGTAIAGRDYIATTGVIDFASGETQKTVKVAVLGDANLDTSETMFLDISGTTQYVADEQIQGVITPAGTSSASR